MIEPVFTCIWNVPSAPERDETKALWRRYHAIVDDAMLEERSRQIVFVMKDKSGNVAGVSTARVARVKFLNGHQFYEFRCFIAPEHRAPGLDTLLAVRTKNFLEEQEGSAPIVKGMIMVIENEAIRKARTKAVWPDTNMVFAGYTPRGHHVRVGYFKGAKI